MDFYITPDEYVAAEKNGVDPRNLERRIRSLGWSKEKAINTPLRKLRNHKKWYAIAKENEIGYETFMNRINTLGWSYERASTEPVNDKLLFLRPHTDDERVIPKEIVSIARSNGIAYNTLWSRITIQNMNMEDAATTPVMSLSESGRKGKAETIRKYGDWNRFVFK